MKIHLIPFVVALFASLMPMSVASAEAKPKDSGKAGAMLRLTDFKVDILKPPAEGYGPIGPMFYFEGYIENHGKVPLERYTIIYRCIAPEGSQCPFSSIKKERVDASLAPGGGYQQIGFGEPLLANGGSLVPGSYEIKAEIEGHPDSAVSATLTVSQGWKRKD